MSQRQPTRKPDYPDTVEGRAAGIDRYLAELLAPESSSLRQALLDNEKAAMPPHDVSATQGKFLQLIVQMTSAERILEIGTLGGYSTIWMAGALGDGGRIDTIEAVPEYAAIANRNIERSGYGNVVNVHQGRALDVLPKLTGPYDVVFIDADKPNNPNYLQWSLKLSRPGTVIIGDNVVRGGAIVDDASDDDRVVGVRRFLQMISEEPRLAATALQTTGEKGWDGFVLARVTS